MTSIPVNTVQELIDHKVGILVYCHNKRCHHRGELDLVKIRERYGPDQRMLFDDLKWKLRCSRCGGREIGMSRQTRPLDKGKGWS